MVDLIRFTNYKNSPDLLQNHEYNQYNSCKFLRITITPTTKNNFYFASNGKFLW